jgi:antitoxin (DNA-binding transcriptional repressor) of toxin-antitoxin stability system
MKTVTMLEFRQRAGAVLREVAEGYAVTLTYRGKAMVRLEPIRPSTPGKTGAVDPFYALDTLAAKDGKSLNNTEMDALVYGA